jgi:hypothetical protein
MRLASNNRTQRTKNPVFLEANEAISVFGSLLSSLTRLSQQGSTEMECSAATADARVRGNPNKVWSFLPCSSPDVLQTLADRPFVEALMWSAGVGIHVGCSGSSTSEFRREIRDQLVPHHPSLFLFQRSVRTCCMCFSLARYQLSLLCWNWPWVTVVLRGRPRNCGSVGLA